MADGLIELWRWDCGARIDGVPCWHYSARDPSGFKPPTLVEKLIAFPAEWDSRVYGDPPAVEGVAAFRPGPDSEPLDAEGVAAFMREHGMGRNPS